MKKQELIKAIINVRLMPTIEDKDVPMEYDRSAALGYRLGYNDAILKMREIFAKNGVSA